MREDKRGQELSGLLHLGLLGASPHALSPHFIPEVPQSLKRRGAFTGEFKESRLLMLMGYQKRVLFNEFDLNNLQKK